MGVDRRPGGDLRRRKRCWGVGGAVVGRADEATEGDVGVVLGVCTRLGRREGWRDGLVVVHGFYEGWGSPREVVCWPRCDGGNALCALRRRRGRQHELVSAVYRGRLLRKEEEGGAMDCYRWVRAEERIASVVEEVQQVGVVR